MLNTHLLPVKRPDFLPFNTNSLQPQNKFIGYVHKMSNELRTSRINQMPRYLDRYRNTRIKFGSFGM